MELRAIKKQSEPKYPTISATVKEPRLLMNNAPKSWKLNKIVTPLLAVFIACAEPKEPEELKEKTEFNIERFRSIDFIKRSLKTAELEKTMTNQFSAKIAPIFAHGSGFGGLGCVAVAPPVFVSEDEARKIIFDALLKENLKFDTVNCPFIEIDAQVPYDEHCHEDSNSVIKVPMDGYNPEYNLAIQYISACDLHNFRLDDCWCGINIPVNLIFAAEYLQNEYKKKSKFHTAIFYDPLTGTDPNHNSTKQEKEDEEARSLEISRKKILAQVEDFIEWLKQEGILEKNNK